VKEDSMITSYEEEEEKKKQTNKCPIKRINI
jgi:hypothetical protein